MKESLCPSQLIKALIEQCNSEKLLQTIIIFLDNDDLTHLHGTSKIMEANFFLQIVNLHFYLRQYVNRVDRSLFYSFFEHPPFQQLEHDLISLNSEQKLSEKFHHFTRQFQQCFSLLQQLLPSAIKKKQLIGEIDQMLFEPDLPLPRMKREDEGIFCNNSFQNMLVNITFQHDEGFEYGVFEDLKQYFMKEEQSYLKKILLTKNKNTIKQKLHTLRFTPYEITFKNLRDFFLQKNSLHNMIAALYALSDIWLHSTKLYIETLTDSFHRYVEFLTRYSIYRNWVLMVQENLSFMFELYGEIYDDVYSNTTAKYYFWRGAMTKWLITMQHLHPSCNTVFLYSLTKQRTKSLLRNVSNIASEEPQTAMGSYLKNRLQMRQYEIKIRDELKRNQSVNEVEDFFTQHEEDLNITLIQYIQYMVDLSVHEESVHWCGHSKQILQKPYTIFQQYFLTENSKFIQTLIEEKTNNSGLLLNKIYALQRQFLKAIEIKPVTMSKVIAQYNASIKSSIDFHTRNVIKEDFDERDEMLGLCNKRKQICFELEEKDMQLYSIYPVAVGKLTNSISTAIDQMYEDEKDSETDKTDLEGLQLTERKSETMDESNPSPFTPSDMLE